MATEIYVRQYESNNQEHLKDVQAKGICGIGAKPVSGSVIQDPKQAGLSESDKKN